MPRSQRDTFDRIIGANMRRLRLARDMSQAELGAYLPVTSRQIQKYERAISRVAAADLARLAFALRCRLEDFFKTN
ncbi:helix-turn-helix domain-containing protein [Bradyrhizobium sp. CCGUVB14]|uniref:helix-turn-helix domain-containing protein n=1 Tax=Bradyrhizobium sp. CCGUVB14 TaxID=2949628 RepID=UPI0020B1797F|nr:helix-turn-helix transcriptional regulator [Bradyrhizobium sp. CCGUVB14]MCP3439814.1 helix-turn-helix domain-containing protein [Bradyrhizobium sp. CCGUVB14]